jgi:hypothetical protein
MLATGTLITEKEGQKRQTLTALSPGTYTE